MKTILFGMIMVLAFGLGCGKGGSSGGSAAGSVVLNIGDQKIMNDDLGGAPADFSGHWAMVKCNVLTAGGQFPCSGEFDFEQGPEIWISGSLSIQGRSNSFWFSGLSVTENSLVDSRNVVRGRIGVRAIFVESEGKETFGAKISNRGELVFKYIDPNGTAVEGTVRSN